MAYEALNKHNISDFPIDFLNILKSYKNLKVITYSEMAKRQNCTVDEIIEINSSEDGVIHYHGKRDQYIIAYNEQVEPAERIYWTLAHEFGHYLMGHHKESTRASLARNSLTEKEYDVFEVEANFFARHFVTPPPLIIDGNLNNHTEVMNFFGVTYTVATNTLNYIQKSSEKGHKFSFPVKISTLFKSFLNKVRYGKTCTSCNTFSYIKNLNYCSICGESEFQNFNRGDDINMKYLGVSHTNGKMDMCPICKNEEILDNSNHCNQCGVFLFNYCSSKEYLDTNGDFRYDCETSLPTNSRHCHICGSISTYLEKGLLKSWEEEQKVQKEKNERLKDPFAIDPQKNFFKLVESDDNPPF